MNLNGQRNCSDIRSIEHKPQADGPVYETDSGFQVGRFRQEVPSRRNHGGRPRQVVQGRWAKVDGEKSRKAGIL